MHGEHQHSDLFVILNDLSSCFKPVELRYGEVDDKKVRLELQCHLNCSPAIGGLSAYLKTFARLDDHANSLAHDFVIISN